MKGEIDNDGRSGYNAPNAQRPTPNAQRPTPIHAQNQDETIHVVLCVYDPSGTYSQHAGVVMTSIFENTKSKVTVHILHDDTLTEDNRNKFIRTAEKYSQGLELHDVTERGKIFPPELIEQVKHLTIGTLYRLFIHEVLDLDKVILLDCDTIVNLDIVELWNINMNGKTIAGVNLYPEIHIPFLWGYKLKLLGIDLKHYINVGVLLMNLRRIRGHRDFLSKSMEHLLSHIEILEIPDEVAFNVILRGDIEFIDKKFNMFMLDKDLSGCIVHTFPSKPWKILSGKPHEILYWDAYLKSAWGENATMSEIMHKLVNVASQSEFFHVHGRQCLIRILLGIKRRVCDICSMATFLLKVLYHNLTRS